MNEQHETANAFVPGLDLCESFYQEAVKPLLQLHFADVQHSAALIGNGSEVLGFDNEMSSDHDWGPRVMLFLKKEDVSKYKPAISEMFSRQLPRRFRNYPTSFSPPNPDPVDHGTQSLDYKQDGPIHHRVEILSQEEFFHSYLGIDLSAPLAAADWLTFPEQKLRTITAGRVFHDQIGLSATRARFSYYPHDVWLYLLAGSWNRIEQDEHLVGRSGQMGDDIGAAIIAARLARDLMRLCFLMEKTYAPYAKWFGTAFSRLKSAERMQPLLHDALKASNWKERELHLCGGFEYAAQLHNALEITEQLPEKVQPFFSRPYRVISMGVFSRAILDRITDPEVKAIASRRMIGSVDQFSDSTDILSDAVWRPALLKLYRD